ncbi:Retrovirus-related Pol polyprotein from transposon 17.6 [Araneus ventricosus]|uniref:Retrovirus-related Pol polyprotein from transposon 17.6 n=1 Tax=Araneus ventricosus TaxID=182803 RepID=A0A4Y2C2X6_ARAVE|nr:Retrovirus-related Pol polyprotein from transposon 17.6 [Araneus ventricosus]
MPIWNLPILKNAFWIENCPAAFQRLVDIFQNGLKVKTLAYLDDVIVLSSTFEEHLEDLRQVFDSLQHFKLHANRSKCNFTCPKFAKISRPLSNLTKKRTSWKWGQDEQTAFERLKEELVSPPVLKQVDQTKPFVLRTDASNYALGAVLIQGKGEEEHPIEYASHLLTSSYRNYSTTEREALAVAWVLEKYRGYVEGAPITVVFDHQPLKWLLSLKSPTGRLARWSLQLQSYDLTVEYIPGKANVIADMLSRPACTHESFSCEICTISTISIDLPSRKVNDIREEQLIKTKI